MKTNKFAFVLAVIAGLLCIGKFVFKYIRGSEADYPILVAGIFILGIGIGFLAKRKT